MLQVLFYDLLPIFPRKFENIANGREPEYVHVLKAVTKLTKD